MTPAPSPAPKHSARRRPDTMLLYSATGGGKTSEIARIAQWVFARRGKRTRLISSDSGWGPAQDLIRTAESPDGIIDAVNTQHLVEPLIFYIKLSEGCWPKLDERGEPMMSGGNYLMKSPSPTLGDEIGLY